MNYLEQNVIDAVGVENIIKCFKFTLKDNQLYNPNKELVGLLHGGILKGLQDKTFLTGTLLDYLSYYVGSPADMLSALYAEYEEDLDIAFPEGWNVTQSNIITLLDFRRSLLQVFIDNRLSIHSCPNTHAFIKFKQPFSKCNIDLRKVTDYGFMLTRDEYNRLERSCAIAKIKLPEPRDFNFVIPYFENPYTIVALDIMSRPTKKPHLVTLIKDSPLSVSNIWSIKPGKRILISDKAPLWIISETLNRTSRLDHVTINIHKDLIGMPQEGTLKRFLSDAVFLIGSQESFDTGSRLVSHIETLRAAHLESDRPYENNLPWEDFVVNKAASLFASSYNDKADNLMEDAAFTYEMRERVRSIVDKKGSSNVKKPKVDTKPRYKTKVYNIRKYEIHETDEGYRFKDTRTESSPRPITNFTLHFTSNVVFEGGAQTYHEGMLRFLGQEYPILVSRDSIMTSRKLEKEANLCYSLNVKNVTNSNVPFIIDHKAASNLTIMFNTNLSKLPAVQGLTSLGKLNGKFYGVTFTKGTQLEVHTSKRVLHPASTSLQYYSGHKVDFSKQESIPGLDDFIKYVASIMNGKADGSLRVISSVDTQSKQFCEKLFRLFGQVKTYYLSDNARGIKQLPGITDYPLLMETHNIEKEQLDSIEVPGIILHEEGESLNLQTFNDYNVNWVFNQILLNLDDCEDVLSDDF
jgi:hypothetical protein